MFLSFKISLCHHFGDLSISSDDIFIKLCFWICKDIIYMGICRSINRLIGVRVNSSNIYNNKRKEKCIWPYIRRNCGLCCNWNMLQYFIKIHLFKCSSGILVNNAGVCYYGCGALNNITANNGTSQQHTT